MKGGKVTVNFGTNPSSPLRYLPDSFSPIPPKESKKSAIKTEFRNIMAVILEPTRELAEQTYEFLNQFKTFLSNPGISVVSDVVDDDDQRIIIDRD